ncbi:hypothetical protein STIAU_7218 [Stigmatella aurantiaca DW4/3-1]|uniref:Uncharacterized protein n=1 Tax=Stigmatella aurantiaca (strain DW4/3-1) TaxID=378806 RepID=Q08QD6_STIAD|nr:hypothetical protein STIAU_7218 [Stigmatella aurantiaca DW4/3-1]
MGCASTPGGSAPWRPASSSRRNVLATCSMRCTRRCRTSAAPRAVRSARGMWRGCWRRRVRSCGGRWRRAGETRPGPRRPSSGHSGWSAACGRRVLRLSPGPRARRWRGCGCASGAKRRPWSWRSGSWRSGQAVAMRGCSWRRPGRARETSRRLGGTSPASSNSGAARMPTCQSSDGPGRSWLGGDTPFAWWAPSPRHPSATRRARSVGWADEPAQAVHQHGNPHQHAGAHRLRGAHREVIEEGEEVAPRAGEAPGDRGEEERPRQPQIEHQRRDGGQGGEGEHGQRSERPRRHAHHDADGDHQHRIQQAHREPLHAGAHPVEAGEGDAAEPPQVNEEDDTAHPGHGGELLGGDQHRGAEEDPLDVMGLLGDAVAHQHGGPAREGEGEAEHALPRELQPGRVRHQQGRCQQRQSGGPQHGVHVGAQVDLREEGERHAQARRLGDRGADEHHAPQHHVHAQEPQHAPRDQGAQNRIQEQIEARQELFPLRGFNQGWVQVEIQGRDGPSTHRRTDGGRRGG